MKSQGLPISTIVIMVMALLVLLAISLLFFRGFDTGSIDSQTAINKCNEKCILEVNWVKANDYPRDPSPYCSLNQTVKGLGEDISCVDLTACEPISGCKLVCDGTEADCE